MKWTKGLRASKHEKNAMSTPDHPKRPGPDPKRLAGLDMLQTAFLIAGVMPGILSITAGPAKNPEQALFRLFVTFGGFTGFAIVTLLKYFLKRK
jgi:hypothetical protein